MKLAIVGSRTITDIGVVIEAVDKSGFEVTHIVSGGARGVDQLAERLAAFSKLPITTYRANWDGVSKGTLHSINLARKKNIPVYVHIVK